MDPEACLIVTGQFDEDPFKFKSCSTSKQRYISLGPYINI